jgi:hypothetical protein
MANRTTIAGILTAVVADPEVCLYERWSFEGVGDVFALDLVAASLESATDYGPIGNSITRVSTRLALTPAGVAWLASHDAAREVARKRRNRAARGRADAARSVGLTRTRSGAWE